MTQTESLALSPGFVDVKLGGARFAYRAQSWKDVKVGLLVAKCPGTWRRPVDKGMNMTQQK